MNILTNYDFKRNEIQNVSLQKLASDPPNPVKGQVYFNSQEDRAKYYDGKEWVGMDANDAQMTGKDIVDTINGSEETINGLRLDVGGAINNATAKTTPVDDDSLGLVDSGDTNKLKKLTWDKLKSTLETYFNTKYNNYSHPLGDGNKHVPATGTTNDGKVLKAGSTAGTFAWETEYSYQHPNHSGDVTSTGDGETSISDNKVTNAKLAKMAAKTIKGNNGATEANASDLSVTDVRTMLNVEDGANKYVHPSTAGNKHIPSGGSDSQILRYKSDGTAEWSAENNTTYSTFNTTTDGLVPKSGESTTKFLKGDGTWAVPTNTTYSTFNASTNGLVPMSGQSTGKFLKGDGTWSDPANDNTTYSAGDGVTLTTTTFKLTTPSTNLTPTSTNAVNATGHTHKIDTETNLSTSASNDKYPTAKAVKDYADGLLGANDAMIFKGIIDASTNPNYPAADAGHTYKISKAGKIGGASGLNVEIGDMIICTVDSTAAGTQATVGANWTIIQVNIDGAVTGPTSATDGAIPLFSGTTGKIIKNSTYKPSSFSLSTHDHDLVYPKKYTATLASSLSQVITHNLGTRDVIVQIRETGSPYAVVITDVEMTSADTVTVMFATAPTSGQYTITIIG